MKINKYFLGLAVAIIGGLTSCNTDVEGDRYSTGRDNVSFEAASKSLSVPVEESTATIAVKLTRGNVASAYTAKYVATASADGIFTDDCNGVVNFEAGQGTATINVKAANLEKEVKYTYTMVLSDADIATADTVTNTQITEYTITVQREGDWTEWKKWNSAGTADYTYGGYFFSGDDPDLPFLYRQSVTSPTKYQLKLQKWGYGVELIMDYDSETGIVYLPETFTGYVHSTYGNIYVTDYSNYKPDSGIYGKFDTKKGIITLVVYYFDADGGWGAGYEYIYIDGYVRADYSITALTYAGIFTDSQQKVFAVGALELAADASNVKAVVIDASADADAVADAIASGELEAVDVEAGNIYVPIAEGQTGNLQIVAVSLDADGAVASTASALFEYYGGGKNPWQSLGKGYLTDNFFITNFYKDQATETVWTPQTYEVEILENQDTPGLYRVVNAFEQALILLNGASAYEPSNMDVDATDPSGVYFLGQPIGYANQTISSYGGYLYSTGNYDLATLKGYGLLGKLENGAITIPQIPYYDENDQPTGEYYQGVRSTSNGLRYAGWMDDGIEFKITLPSAPASVKAKAASSARASRFERSLHGFDVVKNSRSNLNPISALPSKTVKSKKTQYRDRILKK